MEFVVIMMSKAAAEGGSPAGDPMEKRLVPGGRGSAGTAPMLTEGQSVHEVIPM